MAMPKLLPILERIELSLNSVHRRFDRFETVFDSKVNVSDALGIKFYAETPEPGSNTDQLATTAFVQKELELLQTSATTNTVTISPTTSTATAGEDPTTDEAYDARLGEYLEKELATMQENALNLSSEDTFIPRKVPTGLSVATSDDLAIVHDKLNNLLEQVQGVSHSIMQLTDRKTGLSDRDAAEYSAIDYFTGELNSTKAKIISEIQHANDDLCERSLNWFEAGLMPTVAILLVGFMLYARPF